MTIRDLLRTFRIVYTLHGLAIATKIILAFLTREAADRPMIAWGG